MMCTAVIAFWQQTWAPFIFKGASQIADFSSEQHECSRNAEVAVGAGRTPCRGPQRSTGAYRGAPRLREPSPRRLQCRSRCLPLHHLRELQLPLLQSSRPEEWEAWSQAQTPLSPHSQERLISKEQQNQRS